MGTLSGDHHICRSLAAESMKQVNYSDFVHSCHCCLYGADLCCHLPLNDVQRVTPKVAESRLGGSAVFVT